LGRWISDNEDVKGGPRNVVVSYPFWRDFLGSDPRVLGKAIRLSGNSYTVIGVMPSDFSLPKELADVFVSMWVAYPGEAPDRDVHSMHTYWRLKPGDIDAGASGDARRSMQVSSSSFPIRERTRNDTDILCMIPGRKYSSRRTGLFGRWFVLLIAANFAMLLMARAVARQRELMIRALFARQEQPPDSQ
jgi:hypothetical protein